MPDISSSLSKREVNARQNTYTKSEIDLKDGAIQAIAEAAQTTADAAEKKNQEQDQLIAELQKSTHTHGNKNILDKIEQPYTTAERDKLAGLENYTHPNYTAHAKGFYKFANDGLGHVSDAEKVTKDDIVDLGIPGSIPIYNVDVDEEYGYSEGMIIATIVVNQTAHPIVVPIIGENENADYGLMSASDKTKLDGISDNANNYVHPTTSGNKHIPSGGSSGQILRWSADGTAVWGADNNTTYSDATQSTHGLMTAADKKKLDGMDLSKYLPLAGGAMVGDIDMQTNKRDILIGTQRANSSDGTAVAGGTVSEKEPLETGFPKRRSLMGSWLDENNVWQNILSIRHRNGCGYGTSYGFYLKSLLFSTGNLIWNKQIGANEWQGERTLLDSVNFLDYALAKDGTAKKAEAMSNGTLRSGFYVNSSSNATTGYVWFRMATCKISSAYETVNTTFLITNGMSEHALLTCGIRNDGTGKAAESCTLWLSARNSRTLPHDMFRVVSINSSTGVTYELWGQISARWSGVRYTVLDERNIAGGKYNIWTLESHSDADAKTAPTTGNYYVNSIDTSIANTLTDSGWVATTRNTSFTATSTVKCRKYGQLVEVCGEVTFNSTYGSPTVCTLPAGYRPATVVQACGITPSGKQYMIKADTSGVISFGSDSGSTFVKGTTYRVDLTYLLG